MKTKIAVLCVLSILSVCIAAWAGVTTGTGTIGADTRHPVERVDVAWTSDGSGNFLATVGPVYGTLNRIVSKTGATVSTGYTVTVADEDGADLLVGRGTGLTTSTAHVFPCFVTDRGTTTTLQAIVAGELTVTISGAGATKSGTLRIYYKKD